MRRRGLQQLDEEGQQVRSLRSFKTFRNQKRIATKRAAARAEREKKRQEAAKAKPEAVPTIVIDKDEGSHSRKATLAASLEVPKPSHSRKSSVVTDLGTDHARTKSATLKPGDHERHASVQMEEIKVHIDSS